MRGSPRWLSIPSESQQKAFPRPVYQWKARPAQHTSTQRMNRASRRFWRPTHQVSRYFRVLFTYFASPDCCKCTNIGQKVSDNTQERSKRTVLFGTLRDATEEKATWRSPNRNNRNSRIKFHSKSIERDVLECLRSYILVSLKWFEKFDMDRI